MSYLTRSFLPPAFNGVHHVIPITPHTLVEGFGVRDQVGAYCKDNGYQRVLIITDENLIKLGLLDKVTDSLDANGVEYRIFDKVLPNPTFSMVDGATAMGLKMDAQCIIAFGGGSVMDTAKVASGCIKAPNRSSKFMTVQYVLTALNKSVPLITIPTTAGTGAETTAGVVISDDVTHAKHGSITLYAKIKHIILDTELTVGCPPYVTATTGFDAFVHGLEAYISAVHHNKDSDRGKYSMECMKLSWDNLRVVFHDGSNVEARANMAKAAYLGGCSINYESLGYGHSFGHTIGAKFNIPHGAALAIAMPAVLRYQKETDKYAIAEIALELGMGNEGMGIDELFDAFMKELGALIQELGLPETLPELSPADYPELIANVMKDSTLWAVPGVITYHDAEKIFDDMSGGKLHVSSESKAHESMGKVEKGVRIGLCAATAILAAKGLRDNNKGACLPFLAVAGFHALEYFAEKKADSK